MPTHRVSNSAYFFVLAIISSGFASAMGEIGSVEPIVIPGIGGRPVKVGEQSVTIEQGGIIE